MTGTGDAWGMVGLREFSRYPIVEIGGKPVTPGTLFLALVVVVATLLLSRWIKRRAQEALDRSGGSGAAGTVTSLLHYVILLFGFGTAASTLGLDLSTLFAAGAIFAIGLGFAMQSIAQNFVAGIILLVERSVRPGDVIEVEGQVMMVREMGIRASLVRSRDGEDIIIPNAHLIQNPVKNFTISNRDYRIRASVGVSYGADMDAVRGVLADAAATVSKKWGHGQPPQILLVEFGDNSVIWEAAAWTNNPWERRIALHDLRREIWDGLKKAGISIAFPQMDLHVDESLLEVLRAAGQPKKPKGSGSGVG